jgi:hypothetical protein
MTTFPASLERRDGSYGIEVIVLRSFWVLG